MTLTLPGRRGTSKPLPSVTCSQLTLAHVLTCSAPPPGAVPATHGCAHRCALMCSDCVPVYSLLRLLHCTARIVFLLRQAYFNCVSLHLYSVVLRSASGDLTICITNSVKYLRDSLPGQSFARPKV